MDEQRLPFPIHGTRLTGDGDPQRGVGEAARLLYFANLIAQTAGVPVYRLSRQTPYGQVTASVHGPLAFKTAHSVAEPEELPPEEEAEAGAEAVFNHGASARPPRAGFGGLAALLGFLDGAVGGGAAWGVAGTAVAATGNRPAKTSTASPASPKPRPCAKTAWAVSNCSFRISASR